MLQLAAGNPGKMWEIRQLVVSLMRAPNFRSAGPTIQPVERKQTDTQMDTRTLQKILLTQEVKHE